jgi:hypothetical protein
LGDDTIIFLFSSNFGIRIRGGGAVAELSAGWSDSSHSTSGLAAPVVSSLENNLFEDTILERKSLVAAAAAALGRAEDRNGMINVMVTTNFLLEAQTLPRA